MNFIRNIRQAEQIILLSQMLSNVEIPHMLTRDLKIDKHITTDTTYSITVDSGNGVDRMMIDCNDNSRGGAEYLFQVTELRFDETNYEVISTEPDVPLEAAFAKICAMWENA